MKSKKYFTICLLLCGIIFTFTCTKNLTDTETFIISGVVTLEGETDFSDITVALYAPAELDTAIVNMHKRFPTVGFELTQAAVFDHREAEPVYTTKTDKDGKYTLGNLPGGEYNLVASKDGFGWRYLYNINSETQPVTIKLLPEIEVQGELDIYTIWGAYQHVIVKGDVVVPEGGVLMVDKGVVVRVDGYYGIDVKGETTVNGENEIFTWFTINNYSKKNFWKGIYLTSENNESYFEKVLIKHAFYGIVVNKSKTVLKSSIISESDKYGLYVTNLSNINVEKNYFINNNIGIRCESSSNAIFEFNFFYSMLENKDGIGLDSKAANIEFSNNIILSFYKGLLIQYVGMVNCHNNLINLCNIGVEFWDTDKENKGNDREVIFCYNTISNSLDKTINILKQSYPLIEYNNFYQANNKFMIDARYQTYLTKNLIFDIFVVNNYWGTDNEDIVKKYIIDERTDVNNERGLWTIRYIPILLEQQIYAYPL